MSWIKRLENLDNAVTNRLALSDKNGWRVRLARIISSSADSWYWMILLIGIWAFAEEPWRERAVLTAVTIVCLAILVLLIKWLIKRQRPEGEWGQVYRKLDPHSFPSGHAARVMAIAILAFHFELGWFILLFAFWAILVSWSRIALHLHYLIDVIVGWLVGAITTALVMLSFPWVAQLYHQVESIVRNRL